MSKQKNNRTVKWYVVNLLEDLPKDSRILSVKHTFPSVRYTVTYTL